MPRDLKVGYVLKMYPRFSETFVITEILAHEAAGLDVEIFSLRLPIDGKFHEDLARVQAPVTYLPGETLKAAEFWNTQRAAAQRNPRLHTALAESTDEQVDEVHQAILLAQAVQARGITHLHAHFATSATAVARLASKIAGVPFSFTAHAKDIFHQDVREHSLRIKLRDAATVVTVSDFNLHHLRASFGEDAANVQRIYNGLNLEQFAFQPHNHRSRTIVAIGRLIEKKGFEDLVLACETLRDRSENFTCKIIGAGPLHQTLANLIGDKHLQDHVELTGPLPRGSVMHELRNASMLAAPCVIGADGNRDGLPTVLLEAMALGTPCVSTDVTGIPEVVRHEDTGLIVPQHNPQALAIAMQRLLNDQVLSMRLAREARRLMEAEFDIERNTALMRQCCFQPRQVAAANEWAIA